MKTTEAQKAQKRIYYQANKERIILASRAYFKSTSKGPRAYPTTCNKCGIEVEKKERKLCKGMCRPCKREKQRLIKAKKKVPHVPRDKETKRAENRERYLRLHPNAKERGQKVIKPPKEKKVAEIKFKLCVKCGKEKEYAEFEHRKQHCKCCKEEAIQFKNNKVVKERVRKEVVRIEKVIKPPEPKKPKTAKQERPNVKVILPKEDIYGRKYKDVSRDWDKKMEGIRRSIELSKNKTA